MGDAVRLNGRALARSIVGIVSVGVLTAAVATPGWAGEPSAASTSRKAVAPPAPAVAHGAPADTSVVLWWVPPRTAVSRPITDYVIQSSSNGGRSWKRVKDGVSAEPTVTVTGLRNGSDYRFRVAAVAGKRKSHYSPAGSRVTPRPVDCARPGPRMNLAGCDLQGLTGVDLSGSNLSSTFLYGAVPTRLVGSYLEKARVGYTDLRDLNMQGSNLSRSVFSGTELIGANLRGISAREAYLDVTVDGTILSDADLTGTGFRFQGVGVRFNRSVLKGCFFGNDSNAGLGGADFTDADLRDCNFGSVVLDRGRDVPYSIRLTRADLSGADFSSAKTRYLDLEGADLSRADLTHLWSFGGDIGRPTALPPAWQARSGFLLGPGVFMRGDASGADLRGVDLTGADFGFKSIASSGSVNLSGTDLSGANLSRAVGEVVPLDGAKLIGTNLGEASFSESTLKDVDASGANLAGASLYLSDLSRSNFAGADLTEAGLQSVELEDADLRTATLTGIRSSELTGVPLLPAGWAVVDGSLVRRG